MEKTIKNLSLSGGGNYIFAHVGALTEICETHSDVFKIENIAAVSCGAVVGSLYAAGYAPSEMKKVLFDLDWESMICDSGSWINKLYHKYGMYEASKFEDEIDKLICSKTNIKNCTFAQLSKNLTIVTTNLNYQKPVFFNKEFTPHMVISKAVRMSIAYPVLITPVLFEGDLYGDGGECINYPINIFDDLTETIGLAFVAHNENHDGTLKERIAINNPYEYFFSVATTMSRSAYVSQLTPEMIDRSFMIEIPGKITSTQFNLTSEQKELVYQSGIAAVREQIGKMRPTYVYESITTLTELIPPTLEELNAPHGDTEVRD